LPYVFLLFVLMPIIEIAVLIQIGGALGLLPTLAIIVATAILGTIMLRQQGMATLAKVRGRMASGQLPAEQLMEGVLLLIGGVLLLTPGFVTDAFGFFCLVPFTRQWLARRVASRSTVGVFTQAGAGFDPNAGAGPESDSRTVPPRRSSGGDVIEGSYRREDGPE